MTQQDPIAIEAIRRTINGYAMAVDSRDVEAYYPLFDEEAVLEFFGFPPVPGFHCVGRENIRRRASHWTPDRSKDALSRLTSFFRHHLTSMQITLTGADTAQARTYFIVYTDIGPDHSGVYEDELVRRGDEWLFLHRRISMEWRAEGSLLPPLSRTAPGPADIRQAHIDLMNDYAQALDMRDWGLLRSLFTDDAQFSALHHLENSVPDEPFMETEGGDAFVGFIRSAWDGLSATHHFLSNHVVTPGADGTTAEGSCYVRAHHVGNRERADLFEESLARFDFRTVLEDGRWKLRWFRECMFIMLGTADAFPPR